MTSYPALPSSIKTALLILASLLVLLPALATAHPVSAAHMWPHVCQPMRFDEFLAVSKSTGRPVSLGPKGFYIHFGNARCLFLPAEQQGKEDRYSYYHQQFALALL